MTSAFPGTQVNLRTELVPIIRLAFRVARRRDEYRMGWPSTRCHRRPREYPVIRF